MKIAKPPAWCDRLLSHVIYMEQNQSPHLSYAGSLGLRWQKLLDGIKCDEGETSEQRCERIRQSKTGSRTLKQIEAAALAGDAEFLQDFSKGMQLHNNDERDAEAIKRCKWMLAMADHVDRCKSFDGLQKLIWKHRPNDTVKVNSLKRLGKSIGLSFKKR